MVNNRKGGDASEQYRAQKRASARNNNTRSKNCSLFD